MDTDYDRHQAVLYQKEWTWDDMPFYRRGEKLDVAPWHDLDYLDVYEKIYGRPIGGNGIGKLREVALSKISEAENQLYDDRFPYAGDTDFLARNGMGRFPDIAKAQDQQENYAKVLENAGVSIRWIDWGDYPVSAYGPMQSMWAPQELCIINGGAIVPKMGRHPFSFGRAEWLSQWAFWNLNIPTLLTITGKAVCEVGATVWLAQDVYVVGLSPAYNQEGLDQLLPVVARTAGVDDLKVLTIQCRSTDYFNRGTGASAHVSNVIGALDVDKVLVHPPGVDTHSLIWLKKHGFRIIECDPQEQIDLNASVCNVKVLEPGLVVMAAEAANTIARVRDAGVEVIEVPYSGFAHTGGGFHNSTMEIYREPGPSHFA